MGMKDTENRRTLPEAEADGIIEGRNAVIEALRTGTAIDKIYIAKGETDKTLGHFASKARAACLTSSINRISPRVSEAMEDIRYASHSLLV